MQVEGVDLSPTEVADADTWDAFGYDDLVTIMKGLYWGEEPEELEEIQDHALGALWDERKSIQGIIEAAKQVKALIDAVMAKKLGPAGVGRFDDYQVKVAPQRKLKIIDPQGFVEWVGPDWHRVFNVSPNGLRMKGLRALAEERGLDPDHALDTYCEYEQGEGKLATIPLDRAAQKWRKLGHGETVDALDA